MIADVPQNDFPSDAAPERLLTTSEAIRLIATLTGCNVSRSTIWRWHLTGRLPATRIGGRLFAAETSIRSMLERDKRSSVIDSARRGQDAADRLRVKDRQAGWSSGGNS